MSKTTSPLYLEQKANNIANTLVLNHFLLKLRVISWKTYFTYIDQNLGKVI